MNDYVVVVIVTEIAVYRPGFTSFALRNDVVVIQDPEPEVAARRLSVAYSDPGHQVIFRKLTEDIYKAVVLYYPSGHDLAAAEAELSRPWDVTRPWSFCGEK